MGSSQTDQKRLVEMSPFSSATSENGSDNNDEGSGSIADKAKGWLGKIAAPITNMKQEYDKERERAQRLEELKTGATMLLLPEGRGQSSSVRITVSGDGNMVTWTGSGLSGVMALSALREVKPVLQSGFLRSGGPVPNQFCLIADDQTVKLEASSEDVKQQWMSTLEEAASHASEAKAGRKMASQAKRRMGLEERKRENEKRKAEIMKTCGSGGMKHTAAAMMSRA